jgi:hypothetical protein
MLEKATKTKKLFAPFANFCEKLFVGRVEALLLALVFPAETVLPPHVGKAALGGVAAVRVFEAEKLGALGDAFLEAEESVAARSASTGVGWPRRRQRSLKCS